MSKHFVFRCDAYPAIGAGHVMRCLTLANELAKADHAISFATNVSAVATVPALAASPYTLLCLPEATHSAPSEAPAMMGLLPDGCEVLVVDHYGWTAEQHRQCRSWAKRILVIDDLANRPYDCNWLLDQTLGRSAKDYKPWVPAECKLLLGTEYALLRPEFARLRPAALARRDSTQRVERILISLGAGDPDNVTGRALQAVDSLGPDWAVDVLLGATAPHLDSVREQVNAMPHATLHVSTPHVADLMLQADLAIGAAGTTSWERCCLALPTILIVTADNQRDIERTLSKRGAVLSLGWYEDVGIGQLAGAVRMLIDDYAGAQKQADIGSSLCDGIGAARVAQKLIGN